jgi:hypothetical protein
MNMTLEKLVMKNRRIRFDEVRTNGKMLANLLHGLAANCTLRKAQWESGF